MAEPIIWIWLGPTWTEIVPLIRMLCVASLSLFAACLTYPVLVAVGRVRDTLISSLISLPPSLLVIFIASFFGVQAVAASALLTLPFQAVVALYFVSRHLAMSPADLFRATLKSGIVTACSTVGVLVSIVITEFSLAGPILTVAFGGYFCSNGLVSRIGHDQTSAVGPDALGSKWSFAAEISLSWSAGRTTFGSGREIAVEENLTTKLS